MVIGKINFHLIVFKCGIWAGETRKFVSETENLLMGLLNFYQSSFEENSDQATTLNTIVRLNVSVQLDFHDEINGKDICHC